MEIQFDGDRASAGGTLAALLRAAEFSHLVKELRQIDVRGPSDLRRLHQWLRVSLNLPKRGFLFQNQN